MRKISEVEYRNKRILIFYKTINTKLEEGVSKVKLSKLLWVDESRINKIINKEDYWLGYKTIEKYLNILWIK